MTTPDHPAPAPMPEETPGQTPAEDPDAAGGAARIDRDTLDDFLHQHLLGSRSGVKAFRAAAQTWAGTEQEAELQRLGDDVEADQHSLEELIDALGFRTSAPHRVVGAAAEAAGRVNPVNVLRARGSGWTQVELDLLQGMLQAKAALWSVLESLAPHEPALDARRMRELYDRAQDQQAAVRRIADETLAGRFLV